jgi:hypothetical protein
MISRYFVLLSSALAFAGCGGAGPTAQGPAQNPQTEVEAPAIIVVDEVAEREPDPNALPCDGKVYSRSSDGGSDQLHYKTERTAPDSTFEEININGDDNPELFVRSTCEGAKRCEYKVFAACGENRYATLPAKGLVGDGLRTSNKGALHGRVYWRDLILVKFHSKGIKMWETGTRYRFDGRAYQWHSELQ